MTDECIAINYEYIRRNENTSMLMQNIDKIDAQPTGREKPTGSAINSFVVNNGSSGVGEDVSAGFHKYTAYMPTERHASQYNMNHKNRGLALIFNHESFDIPSLKPRQGTNVDCENLSAALKKLHFQVNTFKDCKLREILKHVDHAASQDHTDNDCVVVAILSHGEHGYLYAKDVQYKLDTIWHYFSAHTCPTLAGKPKLFFIQACQGDHFDPGVLMCRTETDGETSMSYKIPVHADFLIAYSTIPGFYSWRNTTNGSWFMQSLVEELNNNGKKHDILTLLTFVNRRVAVDFESCVPDCPIMHQQKQIPCVTSMLTRILRFTDKPSKTT
nr:caspase-1 [Bactrocera oleae]